MAPLLTVMLLTVRMTVLRADQCKRNRRRPQHQLKQEEVRSHLVGGRQPSGGLPRPPWQAGLLGGRHQAGRLLANAALVEAGRQHLLQGLLLRKSLEDQLLEALLANGADRHHECLVATHQVN